MGNGEIFHKRKIPALPQKGPTLFLTLGEELGELKIFQTQKEKIFGRNFAHNWVKI